MAAASENNDGAETAVRRDDVDIIQAREEADIAARLMEEQARILEDATLFRLLCPRTSHDGKSGDASQSDKDSEGARESGSASPKTDEGSSAGRVEPATCCGPRSRFRYANSCDMVLYVLGVIGALGAGAVLPLFSVAFGDVADALVQPTPDALIEAMNTVSLFFVIIGVAAFVAAFLMRAANDIAAERQLKRVRKEYMQALLRQEIAFFETEQDPGEVATKLTEDTLAMKRGLDYNIGMVIQYTGSAVVGLIVGFVYSWDLCLVLFALFPVLIVPTVILANATKAGAQLESRAYAQSGSSATEAISNIRTVVAFNGQQAEVRRYDKHLAFAEIIATRTGRATGLAMGLLFGISLASYSVAVAYGASRIRQSRIDNPLCLLASSAEVGTPTETCYTVGTMLTALFAVLIGASVIGMVGPSLTGFGASAAAAGRLFSVIDRKPEIDSTSTEGYIPPSGRLEGRIELRDVVFAYPSNKATRVLDGVSLVIEPGKTLALVGESGSGKSTIVGLVLRFYDVDEGAVLVDGRDVREYNVAWLRQNIGLVSQEPTLFATSIEENIALGLPEYQSAASEAAAAGHGVPELTDEVRRQVVEAARAAAVHDFATKLPSGYKTRAGERGGQLSGGQKQRVALARAAIRRAAILIGDEATSALDSKSEKEVKAAMDALMTRSSDGSSRRKPTSLLIAHRISTITNADTIVCLSNGRIIEQGTHDELMAARGVYCKLAEGQGIRATTTAAAAAATTTATKASSSSSSSIVLEKAAGKEGDEERTDDPDDATALRKGHSPIATRVAEHREAAFASPSANPLETLFFTALQQTLKPVVTEAEGEETSDKDERLAADEPRVLLLESSFLEMADSERAALLAWWAGCLVSQVLKASEDVAGGADPANALRSLTKAEGGGDEGLMVLRKESEAMIKAAKDAATSISIAKPQVERRGGGVRALCLPPSGDRNTMLGALISVSRPAVPFSRLWHYQSSEVGLLVVGVLAAVVQGMIMPAYALGLSDMTIALYRTGDAFEEAVLYYSLFFVIVGAVAGLANWVAALVFVDLGAKLTTRLRRAAFHALMRQEIAFFDLPFNGSGQLTARLAADASLIKAVASERLGVVLGAVVSMIAGLVISFEASWQLSFVVVALVPLLAAAGMIEMAFALGTGQEAKEAMEDAAGVASEAMGNLRTVTAMGLQPHMQRSFEATLVKPYARAIRGAIMGGLALGFSQAINYGVTFALVFWVGARFLADGIITEPANVFRSFFGLSFGAMGASQAAAMAGDVGKADSAARSLFSVIDRTPKMPSPLPPRTAQEDVGAIVGEDGGGRVNVVVAPSSTAATASAASPGAASSSDAKAAASSEAGVTIEFRDVTFSYPSRPNSEALSSFSAVFKAGSSVGLVGPSGSGKSTIIQLLMRFYDATKGAILVNGKDVREMDVVELRDRLGFVQQEPVLWSDTIMYNVAYGSRGMRKLPPQLGLQTDELTPAATKAAVEEAARAAFAHDFITNRTPLGYSSPAGSATTSRLSGGQKQRVCIGRALMRCNGANSVFVGDEATSALDTQSEKEVQATLDALVSSKAAVSRTSILVAHRLATVRAAGTIAVLRDGKLAEMGSHDDLMRSDGLYASLARAQQIAEHHNDDDNDAAAASSSAAATVDDDDDDDA